MWTRQLQLLLWKDYLIRKRKLVTLIGIVWATAVMLSLYIVRVNIDNADYKTCQFPARVLPSAGMLPFVQSLLCTIENECAPMDRYDEIPSYEKAKLTQLQRQFSPLLYNETVLDAAATVPDALKLLSKLSEVVDEESFTYITKNGLRLQDLFTNPVRVRRYLAEQIGLSDEVAKDMMMSQISFSGILKGNLNRCSTRSLSETLLMENPEHLNATVDRLCSLTDRELQNTMMGIVTEINFSKYIKMIGNMYSKLNGDNRLTALSDTLTAVLRMTRLQSFMPRELAKVVLKEDVDFTYFDLSLISKLMDLFKPTFGDTDAYKTMREFTDNAVSSVEYLSKFLSKQTKNETNDEENETNNDKINFMNNALQLQVTKDDRENESPVDVFNILAKVANFVHKWLPDELKHDVLFYSTLLTKLIEGANRVIEINMNIEEGAYDVSLRHPNGVKILVGLSGAVIEKGFEALTDAGRTQVMSAKIGAPGQMFCNDNRLQSFFQVSSKDAKELKKHLCNEDWKNYMSDLIKSFGIYEVKDVINTMASLVIQETMGKDTSDQLYTFDHNFQVLKNFTSILGIMKVEKPAVEWSRLFNLSDDSEFMKAVRRKGHLGKQILITVHGALAKEVVKQNVILSFKITPVLIDATTLVTGINQQLNAANKGLSKRVRDKYHEILLTVLRTLIDEEKTYKALSTHSEDIMCHGAENASTYLEFDKNSNKETLITTLCDITKAIEDGLKNDSYFGKALENIQNPTHGVFDEVKWTELITNLKNVYVTLDNEYPYLFQYSSYGMDEETRGEVETMVGNAKRFWFGSDAGRSVHLGIKLGFRFLDMMDRPVFNLSDSAWGKMRYGFHALTGPLEIMDDFVNTVCAIFKNKSFISNLPAKTVEALRIIIPNLPQLIIDAIDILVKGDTELQPIIAVLNADPPWPCSSMSGLLQLSPGSKDAVTSIESTLCMDEGSQDQWIDYLEGKRVRRFDLKKWNTTSVDPHVFLKSSSAFDSLIKDGDIIREFIDEIFDETNSTDVTWNYALKMVTEVFKRSDRDDIFRIFFSKLDTILSSVNATPPTSSLSAIWQQYMKCQPKEGSCKNIGRTAWKGTLQFLSVMANNVVGDLLTYFEENNEPNSNVLQLLGFTKQTPLYEMYDKSADLIAVLVNSYLDYGFMSQVHRAAHSQFWDCESLVQSLRPAPGSHIDEAFIKRMQPFTCPSFLHWLSLPKGENSLLNVVAKPNYYFYTMNASNFSSNYEEAFTKTVVLTNLLTDIANKSKTSLEDEHIKLNTIQEKLERAVDTILNFKINETNVSYKLFNDISKKQYVTTVYLTKIVAMINKLATAIQNLKPSDFNIPEEILKQFTTDLSFIQRMFKRKPSEAIAVHFDVITQVTWNGSKNFTDTLEAVCNDLKNNVTRDIVVENQNIKKQLCAKMYRRIYEIVEKEIDEDYEETRQTLVNIADEIKVNENGDKDIVQFLQTSNHLADIKNSIKYAYDLTLPVYLEYLMSNLRHYNIITSFLTGDNWWSALRDLYDGPNAKMFLDSVERSFEIADDVLTNLDGIHIVRLLRDMNLNNSETFCMPNISLSDYVPDKTGALSDIKAQICDEEKGALFNELLTFRFPEQVSDGSVKKPREINYTSLYYEISDTESNLQLLDNGPKSPQRPPWVTEGKLNGLRSVAVQLLSKESLTRIAFGLIGNVVDGGTLFLNNSECTQCSKLTKWLKQLNLQVFKKQEYDILLCHIHDMTLEDVYNSLKNDFHWDISIRELISTRNYTNIELNKSLNEFFELVKLHLLEDILPEETTKLSECLAKNVTKNEFGNATLIFTILSHTARLLRAQTPHLHEVEGIYNMAYLKQISAQIAPNLNVWRPLKKYIVDAKKLSEELKNVLADEIVLKNFEDSQVNLRLLGNGQVQIEDLLKYESGNATWSELCTSVDCDELIQIIANNIDRSKIDLPALQNHEFWRLTFVSNILEHVESLLIHVSKLFGVASRVDVVGVVEGKLAAMIDFVMEILMDDTMMNILQSINGIVEQLHPLLNNTSLKFDISSLATGLSVMHQFKNYLLTNHDLTLQVSKLFPNPDSVEAGLSRLGINNTNLWSLAAPRIHLGEINLKPIFEPQKDGFQISNFVCQPEYLSRVIIPSDLGVVTAEDVFGAVSDQFCDLPDQTAKAVVPVLMQNVNFSVVVEMVTDMLLPQLYAASNLTMEEGATVLEKFPKMAAILPVIQDSVGELGDTISNEPLVQSLKNFSSVGGLLGSSSFLQNAGNMLCGKPFKTNENRFYKAIASSKDFNRAPDVAQLKVLPTDFCRNLYKDIISMEGGKIVWSFVKPLITGKILFTPPTDTVFKIIDKANSTFSHMIRLVNLVHSFARSFSSIEQLSAHREGIAALRRIVTTPGVKESLLGDGDVPDVDAESLFEEFGEIKGIGSLLQRGSDLLHCMNLDRLQVVDDEEQLANEAARLSRVSEFSAGLVFLNAVERDSGLEVEYKIRMDIENVPTTTKLRNYLWIPGPESSFIEHMRYFRGFVQIQDMVDAAIIQLSRSNATRSKREIRTDDKWVVYTQQEPYPCYRKDYFQTSLYESQALMLALFFSLLFTVASAVRFLVSDRETGNSMLMSVMGVNLSTATFSWFIISLCEILATCLCCTLVLKLGNVLPRTDVTLLFAMLVLFGCSVLAFCICEILATCLCCTLVLKLGNVLPRTDVTLLFAMLVLFGCSVLAFCYMFSKLFSSAGVAAACTAIAYLMSFMPFIIILSLEAVITSSLKLLVCLSMSSAMCYSLLFIARFEAMGVGTTWSDIWTTDGSNMNIATGAGMVILDTLIYCSVGLLLDRYFGVKSKQTSITHSKTNMEKAGVSIVNVTKIYHEGTKKAKVALDNVSIELHKGQITTLLGHNGAGKTTLINILTGMLKPTRGHVVIRSDSGSTRARVGACPQRDVLFSALSAREHVQLYAQLKTGKNADEVQEEVERMLEVLSLGAVSLQPVSQLSGGTRRRLCVALAFVGEPQLVSLDEPTAGVDPPARRDIWDMIVKLKEDRTILMTTHHLDEAELLSDQCVIVHKGQIHTTGTPIDIKRTLGNGYRLTVVYPKVTGIPWAHQEATEERIKMLLTAVRTVIKNAALVEISGSEVDVILPFFDGDGVNHDFLSLCSTLESQQLELGFTSYALDCSSLEQVFFNICQQADVPTAGIEFDPDAPCKSASTSSVRSDQTPLVSADGPLKGSSFAQFKALLQARFLHYSRDRWLLFLLIVLPAIFVTVAMGFSLIRPPVDSEFALKLTPAHIEGATDYLVPKPSVYSDMDSSFAERVIENLRSERSARNWTEEDTPNCECTVTKQQCNLTEAMFENRPQMMLLPDVETLNSWLVNTHDVYIEKRYGGYTSALKNNVTNLIAWYNNKGHHTLPSYLNAMHNAILKTVGNGQITTYSHPLKISKEQISKDTVYQHIADAGISGLVLVAYCLIPAGAAIYLVSTRTNQEKRLALLCGVSPAIYWAAVMVADLIIILINMGITAIIFSAFNMPVFVDRNNLPAICLLIFLYGFACGSFVHLSEKLFTDASVANMVLFCGNAFAGLAPTTLLLILDIISESDETDNARWVLHKVFLVLPQFALGDGLLEIAKNTIQAQVLTRFGMDTYSDPFTSELVRYHYIALIVVGSILTALNLANEYNWLDAVFARFRNESIPESVGEMEDMEVAAERKRVLSSIARAKEQNIRLPTLGNINAGFVDTEVKNNSIKRMACCAADVAQCVQLSKAYGDRLAVRNLTLAIPPAQCTALLGENGAGKSTTFSMLTGEVRPTAGQIYLNGKSVNNRELCKGLISYCPQSDAIDPLLTVIEILEFYCKLRGITESKEVIKRTIDMFDLSKYTRVASGRLSGGNKRKLCAAIAFMGRSPLVLLDEPTSGMDPVSRMCLSRGALAACSGARGVLLSTHALHDARRLASRVALLRKGRLSALAPLDECLKRFGGGYVVACKCRSDALAVWRRARSMAPHAVLTVLHATSVHFLIPARAHATVDKKEITSSLSDVFRLMATLQGASDIEDYTVNQSSLDQMFLSFTDRTVKDYDQAEIEPLNAPSPNLTRIENELTDITSL